MKFNQLYKLIVEDKYLKYGQLKDNVKYYIDILNKTAIIYVYHSNVDYEVQYDLDLDTINYIEVKLYIDKTKKQVFDKIMFDKSNDYKKFKKQYPSMLNEFKYYYQKILD